MNIVIILGAPGAGKGTQAEKIREQYRLNHLSTGDLLRQAVADGTSLGELAKGYMDSGKLVPDDVILNIIKEYLESHKGEGILFDGFPRTTNQADGLNDLLKDCDVKVVSLDVPDEAVIERLSSRWTCRECGKIYNALLGSLPENRQCECGGELYQRDDDKPKTIANRLGVYHSQTEPIIEYYRQKGFLYEVDGTGKPDEIFSAVKSVLG
ncbi:MAG: adenylate kinase [Candidatus Electryoneaceae bacterium]|nr:adenylate kinase [Candidatus Electryoneaceae bacterium]